MPPARRARASQRLEKFAAEHDEDQAAEEVYFRKIADQPAGHGEREPCHEQHGGAGQFGIFVYMPGRKGTCAQRMAARKYSLMAAAPFS